MDRQPLVTHSDDLNAFVDDTLSADERARIQSRLAQDPAMERELAELRAAVRLLNGLPELAPRRSFRLGEEFVKTPVAPTQDRIVRFLPIVRSLSVAAALVFMIVAGSLFFDVYGDTGGDFGPTLQGDSGTMGAAGETESGAGSSDEAGDARSDAVSDDGESSMTARGDSASAGDDPMEDLTQLEEPSGNVAQSTMADAIGSPTAQPGDSDRSTWIWSSVFFGGLALALAGIWFMLVKVGRQSAAGRS